MITFTINTQTSEAEITSIFEKELNMNSDEEAAFNIIYSFLPPELLEHICIKRQSKNYISMFCGANDFLRLKYSSRAKWISLRLPRDIVPHNIDNPLFSAQTNKKQLHWRGNLETLDSLKLFKDYIFASCFYIPE